MSDADSAKPAAKPRPVWVVTKGTGLHQIPSDRVAKAIEDGKGRRATPRDLEVAGVRAHSVAD